LARSRNQARYRSPGKIDQNKSPGENRGFFSCG
jgi:hypothetical protein